MANDEASSFPEDVSEYVASAWERYRHRVFEIWRGLSEWIVDRLAPSPGQTILELTAGPGETGFLAAEQLIPGGTLISTDISVSMVDAARRGVEARGLRNVECRTMDAQAIDLPDASVDGVISRFGLMLLPEPAKAFAEIRRVLRPAGRLVYGVMGPPQENPLLTLFVQAFVEHGHPLDADPFGPGGLFSLANHDINKSLLEMAGFGQSEIEDVRGSAHYESLDDYWRIQTAIGGPIAVLAATLPADELAAIRATLAKMFEPFEHDGSYDIPWMAVGVIGQSAATFRSH
ncbi:MAG TPA: methyltransferase domain-containing protein [Acidimicrobiales bacterium]